MQNQPERSCLNLFRLSPKPLGPTRPSAALCPLSVTENLWKKRRPLQVSVGAAQPGSLPTNPRVTSDFAMQLNPLVTFLSPSLTGPVNST